MSGERLPEPAPQQIVELLLEGGRLLLEYNEATGAIHRTLALTAQAVTGESCHVEVSYLGVTVWLANQCPARTFVRELRYNMAVLARVRRTLDRVQSGDLDAGAGLAVLRTVEAETRGHPRWLAALALGVGAASLAALLGADATAVGVSGISAALGLFARQELNRRHASIFTLPLTAALIGSVLGGLAIRLGWTGTHELILIVPTLMLVPGPHLINGLLDLIDNHISMSLARLALAMGIVLASALGIVVGLTLTGVDPQSGSTVSRDHLNLALDMLFAGIVACGFAVFYNTVWRQMGMTAIGGMVGHGVRYLALEAGSGLEFATLFGGLAVGAVSAILARKSRTPVAVISFAGAVTMMPGIDMFKALRGALTLARQGELSDDAVVAGTLANGFVALLVLSALTLGLILGVRIIETFSSHQTSRRRISRG